MEIIAIIVKKNLEMQKELESTQEISNKKATTENKLRLKQNKKKQNLKMHM